MRDFRQCRFKYYIRLIDSTSLWNGVSTWFFFVQLGLGLSWTLKWASTTTPPHPTPPPGTFRPLLDKLRSWNLAQILTKPTRLRNRTHPHPNPPHLTLSLRRKLETQIILSISLNPTHQIELTLTSPSSSPNTTQPTQVTQPKSTQPSSPTQPIPIPMLRTLT